MSLNTHMSIIKEKITDKMKICCWKTHFGTSVIGRCPYCKICIVVPKSIKHKVCPTIDFDDYQKNNKLPAKIYGTHFDHLKSELNYGSTTIDNLYPVCSVCNLQKGTKNNTEFIELIKKNPYFLNSIKSDINYMEIDNDNGICNGISEEDCTGVCNGDAIYDCLYDPDNASSWADACNGSATINYCNECILEGESTTCAMDCNGVWVLGGNNNDCGACESPAFLDDCGICVGGNTGISPCEPDCLGVSGGLAQNDECDICDADSDNDNLCFDCNGDIDGEAYRDNCYNCVGGNVDVSYECSIDCEGVWGGTHLPSFQCANENYACNPLDCLNIGDSFLPEEFNINRIYPNPFNPQVTIEYQISVSGKIQLEIYNIRGQKINVLKNEFILPGHYSVNWDGYSHPSGIYFVILYSNQSIVRKKIILLK